MKQAEIETFLMIVKTKNITKTAENLFLSQPTVSHRLKCLEEELNVKLLTRKKGYKQIELRLRERSLYRSRSAGCLCGRRCSSFSMEEKSCI